MGVPLLEQSKTKTILWCVACTNPNDRMTFRDGNFSFSGKSLVPRGQCSAHKL